MGKLIKAVGASIGLVSEAIKSSNARSESQQEDTVPNLESKTSETLCFATVPNQELSPLNSDDERENVTGSELEDDEEQEEEEDKVDSATNEDEYDEDEAMWELDELQEVEARELLIQGSPEEDANLLSSSIDRNPAPSSPLAKLPLPVILPQRRPNDRSRGFIQAYAPCLAECGIDQAAFLDFLKTFHRMSKASPWLPAVNLAAVAAVAILHGFSVLAGMAIGAVLKHAIEIQSRLRTYNFLDDINRSFFEPRGLYCMSMNYDPSSPAKFTPVDIKSTISSHASIISGLGKLKRKFRNSDGITSDLEFPQFVLLIFPNLDALNPEKLTQQTSLKKAGKFVRDYFDRRAQANFVVRCPESSLAREPAQPFKSRYANSSHPASNGTLLSLLSGGAIDPTKSTKRLKEVAAARRERRANKRDNIRRRRGKEPKVKRTKVTRSFKQNILYLVIINKPSEEELENMI